MKLFSVKHKVSFQSFSIVNKHMMDNSVLYVGFVEEELCLLERPEAVVEVGFHVELQDRGVLALLPVVQNKPVQSIN